MNEKNEILSVDTAAITPTDNAPKEEAAHNFLLGPGILTNLGYLAPDMFRTAQKLKIARKIKLKDKTIWQLRRLFKRFPSMNWTIMQEYAKRLKTEAPEMTATEN
jgi:hypothetical protein